jgi:hypothetical protein
VRDPKYNRALGATDRTLVVVYDLALFGMLLLTAVGLLALVSTDDPLFALIIGVPLLAVAMVPVGVVQVLALAAFRPTRRTTLFVGCAAGLVVTAVAAVAGSVVVGVVLGAIPIAFAAVAWLPAEPFSGRRATAVLVATLAVLAAAVVESKLLV